MLFWNHEFCQNILVKDGKLFFPKVPLSTSHYAKANMKVVFIVMKFYGFMIICF